MMRQLLALVAPLLLLAGCVSADRRQVDALSAEGLQLYRGGSYAEARDHFRAALAVRPDDADLTYNLARCQERLNDPAAAEQLYLRVIEHDPNHLEARHALVVRRIEAGQGDAARKMVATWLASNPQAAGPYVEDAWLRARDGDIVNARGRLMQALDRDPRHPRALADLARIYVKLNRLDRASVLYERSLAANPDQPDIAREAEQLRAKGVGRPRPD